MKSKVEKNGGRRMRRDDRYDGTMQDAVTPINQGFRLVRDAGLERDNKRGERYSRGHEFLRLVVPSRSSGRGSSSRRRLLPAHLRQRVIHDSAQAQSYWPLLLSRSGSRGRSALLRSCLRFQHAWHAEGRGRRRRGETIVRPRDVGRC